MRRATTRPVAILLAICCSSDRVRGDDELRGLSAPQAAIEGLTPAQGNIRRGEPGFRALYTVHRDGGNVEFLLAAPGMITTGDPAWSHDGTMVACNGLPKLEAFGESRMFVCRVGGLGQGVVRDLGYGNTPDWSPDDRRIAFMLNDGNPINVKGGVWLVNVDGTDRRWLAPGWYPRWSPDGKRICAHGWSEDNERTTALFIIDSEIGERRRLLNSEGWSLLNYGGSWSPDGKRVAFAGTFQGRQRVAAIFLSGSDTSIRILYSSDGQEIFGPPAWSPDGREIVFGMQHPDDTAGAAPRQWWNSYLYSLAADGRSPPVLIERQKVGRINRGPNWSPDGSKVIFSSER